MRNEWTKRIAERDYRAVLYAIEVNKAIAAYWARAMSKTGPMPIVTDSFDLAKSTPEQWQEIWEKCMSHPEVAAQYWVDG